MAGTRAAGKCRRPWSRIATSLMTFLVLIASTMVVTAVDANASISCVSRTRHWSVEDGSVSVKISWIELSVEVCTDGNSLTSTASSTNYDMTGPGEAAGFVTKVGSAVRTHFTSGGFNGGYVLYTAGATNKDCIPYILTFCGITEDFNVAGSATMLSALIAKTDGSTSEVLLHGRVIKFRWGWACTNSACKVRLS